MLNDRRAALLLPGDPLGEYLIDERDTVRLVLRISEGPSDDALDPSPEDW